MASSRIVIPAAAAPPVTPPGVLLVRDGISMGTSWSLRAIVPRGVTASAVEQAVAAALDSVIGQMSQWAPESALSRFNRAPGATWHAVPDGFLTVLREALRVAALSGGAFDPTCGALTEMWGFGAAEPSDLPSTSDVDGARGTMGWRRVLIDEAGRVFQPGGLTLDFGGIAKGFAVDLAVDALRRLGVPSGLMEIGGELSGWGVKPDGTPWWVGLDRPPGAALAEDDPLVALHELAIASSGDFQRTRLDGDRRYSHTLDPATGAPLEAGAPALVTVLHRSCMTADALATALMVMGAAQGAAVAAREGIAARFVTVDDRGAHEVLTPAFAAMLN